jgi:prepilin peptidase CpaA
MIVPTPHGFVLLLVIAALVTVGIYDLRLRRIPNWLVAAIAATGLTHAFIAGGTHAALAAIFGAMSGVVLLVWPFVCGLLGAGDVKFLGALGVWVGAAGTLRVVLVGSLVGGMLAVAILARLRRTERIAVGRTLKSFAHSGILAVPAVEDLSRSRGIPYGVALCVAGAWTLYVGV